MSITLHGAFQSYTFNPQDAANCLGQGGMGVVFKGNTTEGNMPVAIKVLYKEITSNLSAVERERQSAGIRIDHRNLIKMLDFVEQNGIFHIVSQLVEGTTLHAWLQQLQQENKKPDISAVHNIIGQVMDGLIALHSHQPAVIHRDIDPSNIMLCTDGTVKIMDFGIARISDGKRKSLTGMGTVIGKPHYSPPEQIRGESDKINQRTDIYALGITLYEMLTGNPPFNATNEYDIMKMQIEKPLPQHAAIPATVFRVIQKATEKRQERRYATVKDFKQDLQAAFKQSEGSTQVVPPNKQKRTVNLILLLLAAILAVAWIREKVEHRGVAGKYQQLFAEATPITITDIQFANCDNNSNILADFGSPLYSSSLRYITPKLFFTVNGNTSNTLLLVLKYYDKEKLIRNVAYEKREDLYTRYTQFVPITVGSTDNSVRLIGFGSEKSTFNPGSHKLEVWLGNVMLYSKEFNIRYGN